MDTKLTTKTLTDFTEEAIKKYIKETVEERAIPDFKDGLKPVQRRILWDMYKQGLFHNLAHRKAAKVVGDVIARFHCHGDCLDGNTRIYCLDGNSYRIKDLLGKEIEVLAYDQETKQIVPALAKNFRSIEKDNLYTLKLSNGGEIKCSGNHPILMEDGSYKKAEDLKSGDFLYSGFLRDTLRPDIWIEGCCYLIQGIQKKFLTEDSSTVIHHIDHNPRNNTRANLQILTRSEHAFLHKDYLKGLANGRKAMFTGNSALREYIKQKNRTLRKNYNKIQTLDKALRYRDWLQEHNIKITLDSYAQHRDVKICKRYNVPYFSTLSKFGINTIEDFIKADINDYKIKYEKVDQKETNKPNKEKITLNSTNSRISKTLIIIRKLFEQGKELNRINYSQMKSYYLQTKGKGRSGFSNRCIPSYDFIEEIGITEILQNTSRRFTQIISIEKQEGNFQLYDFTVDKYHNMAILNSDAGISFVHNSSVFQAMVNMAQPNKKYYFIHGQGNWGSWSGDPAAAMRYVECKLSELADDCLLNKDYLKVVPYVDNFDGTEKEPIYLPARLPFALMSNLAGIATAVRTCLPCLEIESLVDCCIYYLKNKDLPTTEISKLKFDDIYGGKCVSTQEEIIKLFTDGIASLTFEPTYNVYKDKIELIGIPDGFDFDKVAEKLEELPEVKSVKDESTKDIKIGIYLTKSYNKDSLEKILSKTRVKFNYSINILNRQIQGEDIQANYKETSVLAVIKNWCKYRVKLEKDYLRNLIKEKQADIDYQSLLYKASTNLKVIFKALQEQDSKAILMDKLKITDKEADIILDLPIRRLSKLSEEKTKNLLDNLKKDLECLNSKLNNVVNEVVKDLQGLKRKYGNGAKNQRS